MWILPLKAADPDPEVLFSMMALRRAWRQVRRSGDSPGSDGVNAQTFELNIDTELNRLRQHILSGMYQPRPVKQFYVKKSNGKQRPISIWTLRDRVAQRVVHDYLLSISEGIFLECSYGFRLGRSTDMAINAVIAGRDEGLQWVLDADIADCFSSIPVEPLLAQMRRITSSPFVMKLIEQWLYTPIQGERGSSVGVSQGGVISPLLANVYLHRFDEMVTAALPALRLIRFADDFIVLSRTEAEVVWSLEVARRSLENLHLALNMRKTRITRFEEGFQFLGATFQGMHHELPRRSFYLQSDEG